MSRNANVELLRSQGCTVKVYHLRRYWFVEKGQPVVKELPSCCVDSVRYALPTGGTTAVVVTTPDGEEYTGFAECSVNDHYNRKRGVMIALNRAIANKNWLG